MRQVPQRVLRERGSRPAGTPSPGRAGGAGYDEQLSGQLVVHRDGTVAYCTEETGGGTCAGEDHPHRGRILRLPSRSTATHCRVLHPRPRHLAVELSEGPSGVDALGRPRTSVQGRARRPRAADHDAVPSRAARIDTPITTPRGEPVVHHLFHLSRPGADPLGDIGTRRNPGAEEPAPTECGPERSEVSVSADLRRLPRVCIATERSPTAPRSSTAGSCAGYDMPHLAGVMACRITPRGTRCRHCDEVMRLRLIMAPDFVPDASAHRRQLKRRRRRKRR